MSSGARRGGWCVKRIAAIRQEPHSRGPVERANKNTARVRLVRIDAVKKVDAVGQEHRKSVSFTGTAISREFGHGNRSTSSGGDAGNSASGTRREHNHTVAIPASAAAAARVAQSLRRTTGDCDLLELAPGEKSEICAVGGPERIGGSIAAR